MTIVGKTITGSKLVSGFIELPTHLELTAVDHCNISCRNCNHASPLMPRWFADPETVYRDFSILTKYVRPKFIKVLGGEPLLHPHLDAVIQAARATGISNHFTLTTNGTLLHKASDALWQAIDEVEISLYPGVNKAINNIPLAKKKAEHFGKILTVYKYGQFRTTFGLKSTTNSAIIEKIFSACKIANFWGCHAVREGYFYKCPQSIYASLLTGRDVANDGFAIIDDDSFQTKLMAFLNSSAPLSSCAYCVGTVGRQEAASLLPRKDWREHIDKSTEEILDYDWLERSLITQDDCDDCKIPVSSTHPTLFRNHTWITNVFTSSWPVLYRLGLVNRGKPPVRQSAVAASRLYASKKGGNFKNALLKTRGKE